MRSNMRSLLPLISIAALRAFENLGTKIDTMYTNVSSLL